jgi:hypothetical protein
MQKAADGRTTESPFTGEAMQRLESANLEGRYGKGSRSFCSNGNPLQVTAGEYEAIAGSAFAYARATSFIPDFFAPILFMEDTHFLSHDENSGAAT